MDALVYGYPKRFELDYLQGDEVQGFEGTCALTSVANLLTQSGRPTSEADVIQRAITPSVLFLLRAGRRASSRLQSMRSVNDETTRLVA